MSDFWNSWPRTQVWTAWVSLYVNFFDKYSTVDVFIHKVFCSSFIVRIMHSTYKRCYLTHLFCQYVTRVNHRLLSFGGVNGYMQIFDCKVGGVVGIPNLTPHIVPASSEIHSWRYCISWIIQSKTFSLLHIL